MEADKLQAQTFPLDFNAEGWAAEDVVGWVFLGSLAETNRQEWKDCVSYACRTLDRERQSISVGLSPATRNAVDTLTSFLRDREPGLSASTDKPPIVWARIAIQYWLSHGGYHKRFVSKFSDWLTEQGNLDVRVAPKLRLRKDSDSETTNGARPRRKAKQLVMPAFLLDPFPATNFSRQSVSVRPVQKPVAMLSAPEAVGRDEKLIKMLGPNLYSCVKGVIEKAVTSGSIPNLSARRDPKTDRYQYAGRHRDLCKDILGSYKNEMGQYKESTLERAVRHFVVSRRSWK